MSGRKTLMPEGFWDRFERAVYEANNAGYNNSKICKAAGYSPHRLMDCILDRRLPSILILAEVSRCSGRSMNWIIYGKE